MIQQRTATPTIARMGPLAAVVLAAGLSIGFIAGQAAPDFLGSLGASSVSVTTTLPQNADYAIRHLNVTVPLSEADDYGVRHLTVPTLTEVDDYGTRHATTTPLTPADDYGNRHQSAP
jgi:hypothetical protein